MRGELFVTETLRDEVTARMESLGFKVPAEFYLDDGYNPVFPSDLNPGYQGQVEIADGDGVRIGKVGFSLILNQSYTGGPYEEIVVVGDIIVVLYPKVPGGK